MSQLTAELPAVEEFLSEGLITEVLSTIKSGKEAAAYLCRAGRELGPKYVVAKVYHERNQRNFNRDTIYQEGRVILNGQIARAVAKKTEMGREAQAAMWVDYEYEALCALFDAGADVPEPFACTGQALLMEYVGERDTAAPQLQSASLTREEAEAALERLRWNVRLFLSHNLVHGDLSAFNVLWHRGRAIVIDFPQAVDPRFAPAARSLLERDLKNLSRYFSRHQIAFDAQAEAERLWDDFRFDRVADGL